MTRVIPAASQVLDRVAVADAAAELKRDFDRRKNGANGWCIHRMSRERAIEIDEMQIFESRGLERARLRRGIIVEDRCLRHVALPKAHAASVFQIDRGKNNHDEILTGATSESAQETQVRSPDFSPDGTASR